MMMITIHTVELKGGQIVHYEENYISISYVIYKIIHILIYLIFNLFYFEETNRKKCNFFNGRGNFFFFWYK